MLKIKKPMSRRALLQHAVENGIILPASFYSQKHAAEITEIAASGMKMASVDQIMAVVDALKKNVLDGGKTFNEFKQLAAQMNWELPAWRVDLVLRNHMQNVFQAGAWQTYEKWQASRPYLMYVAVNDSRTRPNHRLLHGVIRRVDDNDFWSRYAPPNGHNCRCSLHSLTEEEAMRRGGVTRRIPRGAGPDPGWDNHPWKGRVASAKKLESGKADWFNERIREANRRIREMEKKR